MPPRPCCCCSRRAHRGKRRSGAEQEVGTTRAEQALPGGGGCDEFEAPPRDDKGKQPRPRHVLGAHLLAAPVALHLEEDAGRSVSEQIGILGYHGGDVPPLGQVGHLGVGLVGGDEEEHGPVVLGLASVADAALRCCFR